MAAPRAACRAFPPDWNPWRIAAPCRPSSPDSADRKHRGKNLFPPASWRRCARRTAGSFPRCRFPRPPRDHPAGEIPFGRRDNSDDTSGSAPPDCRGSCPLLETGRCKPRTQQTERPAARKTNADAGRRPPPTGPANAPENCLRSTPSSRLNPPSPRTPPCRSTRLP